MKVELSPDEVELIVVALRFIHSVNSKHAEHSAEAYEARILIDKLTALTPQAPQGQPQRYQ